MFPSSKNASCTLYSVSYMCMFKMIRTVEDRNRWGGGGGGSRICKDRNGPFLHAELKEST